MSTRKEVQQEKALRSLSIIMPEVGEPRFTFTGIWSNALLERMMFKAVKALRQDKVRQAQEALRRSTEVDKQAKTAQEV